MNKTKTSGGFRRVVSAAAAIALAALSVSGCSSSPGSSTASASTSSNKPVEISFWSWLPDIQKTIDKFEAANPNITVKLENVGVGVDEYTKIQNAVDAKKGGPDVAQMTYDSIPNFILTGALADLTQYGGKGIGDLFLPGVVGLVKKDNGIYGVPQDFGPGVMYYRADIFQELGLAVPATWDEYAADAAKIKASSPKRNITFIDPGLVDAAYMGLWQLDAKPWGITGKSDLSVDLTSPKATQWADYWGNLNSKNLLIKSTMGSDEWFRQMGAGQIATWLVGAWGLQALTGNLPANTGLWRVAPQPQWKAGDTATSQFGGSGTVILQQSEKKEAATKFAMWINSDPAGVESLKNDNGLLPTTNAAWKDPAFVDEKIKYLGGQQARQIFADSAQNSVVGWQWLPFQPYVGTVYKDTVGQAIANKTSIADGFKAWQKRIKDYGTEQGFKVK